MKEVDDYLDEKYPIRWQGERLRIEHSRYLSNNAPAIQLMAWNEDTATEVIYMTATVNVEHADLDDDEVVIKDYSENSGVLQVLIKEGEIAKPHDKVMLGYTRGFICQLIN